MYGSKKAAAKWDREQFARRVERQFKRRSWDRSDYGSEFTIDHRLPCCAFDLHKAEQRAMCSHWSNLQVLSLDENHRKNGNYSKVESPMLQNAMALDIRTSASAGVAIQAVAKRAQANLS